MSLPSELLILGLLVLANAVLAAAETAVVSARKGPLRRAAAGGNRGAARALALADNPTRFLSLVQFWLTFSSMLAGVLGGAELAGKVAGRLAAFSWLAGAQRPVAFAIVACGLTGFLYFFGELLPKRIAATNPERVAALLARMVQALAWLAAPILGVLGAVTDAFAKLIGAHPRSAAEAVSDEEVRALVEQGLHAGVFQRAEKEMVEGVLALDQLPVKAIMTPRPKIVFLNIDDPEETNWRKIVTSGHSYFPVFQTNRDQVVGMVAVKALWAHSAIGLPTTLKNLVTPALSVPETMMAIQLLEQFKKSGRHMAIVVDEFGSVQGLVTLIDVLEAIVGDMPEPGRRDQPQARKRDDGSWLVDATLPIGELKRTLGLDQSLPHEQDAEFQTLGGFVVTQFGRIPAAGDHFEWGGWRFEVVDMDRHRVDKVLLSSQPTPTAAHAETPPPSA